MRAMHLLEKIDTYTNLLYIMITATAITTSMTPIDPPIAGAEEVTSIISFSSLFCKYFKSFKIEVY